MLRPFFCTSISLCAHFCASTSVVRAEATHRTSDTEREDVFAGFDFPIDESEMYESEVVGHRILPTDEIPGFAETVDLVEHPDPQGDVSDVLSKSVGVEVRTMGGLGAYGAVSVRGSTPNQVPIFLDGILLNIGGTSSVNLGDFSSDLLESIEIYRGNAPLRLGISGVGGAIVLRTRTFDTNALEYHMGFGSWNTWRLSTLYGGRFGQTDVLGIVLGQHSDGDFRYYNRNGTLNNKDDDAIVRRTNNDHTAYSALLKVHRRIRTVDFSLLNDFYDKEARIPGIDQMVGKSRSTLDTLRNAVDLRIAQSLGEKTDWSLDLSHLFRFERFRDISNAIGIGREENLYRTHGVSGIALVKHDFTSRQNSTFRLGIRLEHYDEERLLLSPEDRQAPTLRVKTEMGIEHEWIPFDRLRIVPTLRGELHDTHFGGGPSPSLLSDLAPASKTDFYFSPSLGVRLEPVRDLVLRVNAGRYVRTPDLAELYGDRGSVIGNPNLRAETGYNGDFGVTYTYAGGSHFNFLKIDAAWFGSFVEDLISFKQNSQSTATPVNIDKAGILGAEISLRLKVWRLITLSGNYTYFHGENRSDSSLYFEKALPGRPVHEAYGRLDIEKFFERFSMGAWFDADYAGKAYTGPYNDEKSVTMRFHLGLGAEGTIERLGLSFTFEIDNLLDTLVFKNTAGDWLPMSDYKSFPLPGRSFFGSVRWKAHKGLK